MNIDYVIKFIMYNNYCKRYYLIFYKCTAQLKNNIIIRLNTNKLNLFNNYDIQVIVTKNIIKSFSKKKKTNLFIALIIISINVVYFP